MIWGLRVPRRRVRRRKEAFQSPFWQITALERIYFFRQRSHGVISLRRTRDNPASNGNLPEQPFWRRSRPWPTLRQSGPEYSRRVQIEQIVRRMTQAAPSFSAVGLQIWLHAALQRLLGNCRRAGMGRSGAREARSNSRGTRGAEGGLSESRDRPRHAASPSSENPSLATSRDMVWHPIGLWIGLLGTG